MRPRWLTMHRAVLLGLVALAVASLAVSIVDEEFAYRPDELITSLAIAILVSCGVSFGCAALVRVPPGSDSWLITALILFFILPGVSDGGTAATMVLGAAAAAASKYVVVWRRRLIVNPAVAGAVVVYVCAYAEIGSISYPPWWVAAEPLLIPMVVIGVAVVTAIREWLLVAVFLAASLLTIGVLELIEGGQDLSIWLISSPMFFVAAIMLPEPLTSPNTRVHRAVYGVLVGVLMYCQHAIPIGSSVSIEFVPEIALLIGCLYAFVVRILGRRGAGRVALDVVGVVPIAAQTYSMTVRPRRVVAFSPGQWAQLSVPQWSAAIGQRSRRVLSVCSAPEDSELSFAFTVGDEPSQFKADLIDGRTPTLLLDDVGGDFVLGSRDRPTILIGSGIGITPYRAMLRALCAQPVTRDLSWLTIVQVIRSDDRAVFDDDLVGAESAGARVIVRVSSSLTAGIAADELRGLIGDAEPGSHVYVSGAPGFVRLTTRSVRSVVPGTRWRPDRIHADSFLGY